MITCRTHLKRGDLLLERYKVKAFLGAGGMSTVYLAEDITEKQKNYAIKESRLNPRWAHQLMVEAKVLGELDHPQLPRVAELFLSGDRKYFYIAQDYIEGITLAKLFFQHNGKLPTSVLLGFFIQICEILDHLHFHNIIYQDLKPGNLMIDQGGQVKLIDFGIAQKYGDRHGNEKLRIGTVGFAAPEQYKGNETDARTDLYSFGAMMFYLLAGGQYFGRCQKDLCELRPDLPKKLLQCIERLTRVDPEERLQSAEEVRYVLERSLKKLRNRVRPLLWKQG